MPYALRFDGVNDVVTIPNGMSGNIGTSAYSFRVKSGPNGITVPATLNRGFIGATLASASGLVVTSGGLLEVWRVGARLYGSAAQRLFTGVPFDFTLSHLADGTWTITDNLTSTVTDSGTYTNNITWSGSGVLNQLGKNSSNANNSCLAGDIALIAVTGLLNADTWDADLSGGSGSILPSTSGTNNGTLNNFTVPSCWIFYSSGASYTLTADGATFSYSGGIALTTYNRLLSADGGSFNYSGGVAATLLNRLIASDGATFGYSGGSSALLYGRALQAAGGSFSYSGGVATFVYNPITGYVLNADGGIFSYAGGEAALSFNQNYPTANPNDYTVSAYLSTDSTYTARLSETSTINAIMSTETTYAARLN